MQIENLYTTPKEFSVGTRILIWGDMHLPLQKQRLAKYWRLKSLQSIVSLPNVTKGIPKENLFYPNFSPSVLFKCSLQINTLKAWWIQLYGSILIFLLFRFFPLSLYSVEFEIRLQSKMLTLIITDCKRKKNVINAYY